MWSFLLCFRIFAILVHSLYRCWQFVTSVKSDNMFRNKHNQDIQTSEEIFIKSNLKYIPKSDCKFSSWMTQPEIECRGKVRGCDALQKVSEGLFIRNRAKGYILCSWKHPLSLQSDKLKNFAPITLVRSDFLGKIYLMSSCPFKL